MSRKFMDDELVTRITRGHAHWQKNAHGEAAKRGFTAHYLERQGFCSPIYRAIRTGKIDALIARCPAEVRRDWSYRPRDYWTREQTLRALEEFYRVWNTDTEKGKPAGVRWSRAYLRRVPGGKALLRSVDVEPIRVEVFLRALGGPILTEWHRHHYQWDPERMRERIREVHRCWEGDSVHGKPAGKRFNYHYLACYSGLEIVGAVRDHYLGGIHRFIRTVPEAAADWQCRRHLSHSIVRAEICALYRQWLRDPRGRVVCMPFGKVYFRFYGKETYVQYLLRNGVRRVLSGQSFRVIRDTLGRLPPGFRSIAMRRRRASLYRKEVLHAD